MKKVRMRFYVEPRGSWTFASELERVRVSTRPRRIPRRAPENQRWPQINVAGRVERVVIVPGGLGA